MRLVDADKLMEKVKKWLPPDPCGREEKEYPFETDICVSMLMEIEEAPTVVELIRCRDCKFFRHNYHYNRDICESPQGCVRPEPDGYCGYGKRKEKNGEQKSDRNETE